MTSELLEELGSCDTYVSKFDRIFPRDDYPQGVEITEDVCAQNADEFAWDWAVEQLLDGDDGYRAYQETLNELYAQYTKFEDELRERKNAWREEWRQRYSEPDWDTPREAREAYNALVTAYNEQVAAESLTGSQRAARAFGRTFAEHPEYRSQRVIRAEETSIAKFHESTINAYTDVEHALANARAQLEVYATRVPELERREAELRTAALTARAARAEREAALAESRAAEAQNLADRMRRDADEAKARAAELAATANAGSDADATTDEVVDETSDSSTSESEPVTTGS